MIPFLLVTAMEFKDLFGRFVRGTCRFLMATLGEVIHYFKDEEVYYVVSNY